MRLSERESGCVRDRESVLSVSVYVCVREREMRRLIDRETERDREGERANVQENESERPDTTETC